MIEIAYAYTAEDLIKTAEDNMPLSLVDVEWVIDHTEPRCVHMDNRCEDCRFWAQTDVHNRNGICDNPSNRATLLRWNFEYCSRFDRKESM